MKKQSAITAAGLGILIGLIQPYHASGANLEGKLKHIDVNNIALVEKVLTSPSTIRLAHHLVGKLHVSGYPKTEEQAWMLLRVVQKLEAEENHSAYREALKQLSEGHQALTIAKRIRHNFYLDYLWAAKRHHSEGEVSSIEHFNHFPIRRLYINTPEKMQTFLAVLRGPSFITDFYSNDHEGTGDDRNERTRRMFRKVAFSVFVENGKFNPDFRQMLWHQYWALPDRTHSQYEPVKQFFTSYLKSGYCQLFLEAR